MAEDKFIFPLDLPLPTTIDLLRIITLREASKLSSLSPDTLEEVYPEKVIDLSPKRKGMRLGHALMLGAKKT
jgi:hypothetical protein